MSAIPNIGPAAHLDQAPRRILIADDDLSFRQSLQWILTTWGYRVDTAANGGEAWERLRNKPPHLALLDWMMPGYSGIELCRKARTLTDVERSYIILLSGRTGTEDVVAGLDAGADDYLTKPVDFAELQARLQVGFRMVALQQQLTERARVLEATLTEVRQLQAQAEEARRREHFLALHDSLTGLPNRQLFFDRVQHALTQAQREGQLAAILYLDLDGFKEINDVMGHSAGDQVLRVVAQRVTACLRASDTVARLGGDEFAIIAESLAKPADAWTIAEKLLHEIRQAVVVDGQKVAIGASLGISLFPSDGQDVQTLIQRADVAMYRAKRQGKNRFLLYDQALDARLQNGAVLENDLREALSRRQLLLHYQPQVHLATKAFTGTEALLRWQHPGTGLILPKDFIPMAEETGLITSIGAWAIRTACRQHSAECSRGGPHLRTAVNLSARQFRGVHLVETVEDILEETNLDPQCLELEITETVAMQNLDHSIATMFRLKDMGVKLAVDDFGTGYSSLSYLKRFPIDRLKIDRSFVQGIPEDAEDAAITAAIVSLAHSLKVGVLAEGVETVAQWQFLRSLGCDEAQGYLFSPPVPVEKLRELVLADVAF